VRGWGKLFLIAVVALVVSACASGPDGNPCLSVVRGACIVLDGMPTDYGLTEAEIIDQVDRIIVASFQEWGAPDNLLDGYTIIIHWTPFVCGDQPGWIGGCTYPARKEMNIYFNAAGYSLCPAAAILHEIGHIELERRGVPFADPRHEDPLWTQVNLQRFALECP
jgi:hypothetical protein